ncbi:MAG: hypothetical protein Q8O76_15050, partial [Chloroflexota bacterium]|nr:hypothetical protein [Chloroflexota bacterium]
MDDTIGEKGQDEERPLVPAQRDGRVAEPSRDGADPEQQPAEVEAPSEASQINRYLDRGYSVKQIIALGFARETVRDEAAKRIKPEGGPAVV